MNDKQIVKDAIAHAGITQAALSARLGYANKTSLATMLSRPSDLRSNVLLKILDALGFEVVVRPKNRSDKTEWILRDEDSECKSEIPDIDKIKSEMKPPAKR